MKNPAKKEREQFLAWFEAYADTVFRHCLYRVSDRDIAQELTQEVFAKTWRYLAQGHSIQYPRAFLYRAANHLVIDFYKKKRAQSFDALSEQQLPIGNAHEHMAQAADASLAQDAMQRLPTPYRDVLRLRFLYGFSPKEIAALLHETPNAISIRITRAKKQLHQYCTSS